MREYVLVLFNQKLVEIRIGTYDSDLKNRTRKRHLVDVGTEFDIAAEKTTHLGGQAASMDKAHVICSQTAFGYFTACSNKCSKREFKSGADSNVAERQQIPKPHKLVPFA